MKNETKNIKTNIQNRFGNIKNREGVVLIITDEKYIKHRTNNTVTTYSKVYYKVLLIGDIVKIVAKDLNERNKDLHINSVSLQ